jgi:hypothetical protein
MDVQQILSPLERNGGYFPKAAIREAVARRDQIIPLLLDVLESVARDPQSFASDPERLIHIYAMYLLAQFRETRAYPLLVQVFSAPGELIMDLAGDVVTEDLGSILASVSGGDMSGITSLVENEQANEYVRSAALKGLVTLVACGKQTRDAVMAYFRGLFHTLARTPGNVWNGLASECTTLCPKEVLDELRLAFRDELIEPFYIRWDDIVDGLAVGPGAAVRKLQERYRLIDDVEKEIGWWACFEENKGKWDSAQVNFRPPPVRKAQVKVGRNDSCPCGSGKKFKKCCGK